MPNPTLPQIIADMLAYEAEQFDGRWYAYCGTVSVGPFDTEEEADSYGESATGHWESTFREGEVSGADLVDAFTAWREQLKAATPDAQAVCDALNDTPTVKAADRIIAQFLRALGFEDIAFLWREAVGDDEALTCSECGDDLDDAGDGYDGLCASCADKAEVGDA